MSTGLLAVAEMIGMIGKAARLAATEIRDATEAQRETSVATSSVARAAGSPAGTMGATQGGSGVTPATLATALQITRGRLR